MPSPRPPCLVPDPTRAPGRVLALAGEAAGRLGAGRADCPYWDDDGRSVPWLDGWWQGRRRWERAARLPKEPDPAGGDVPSPAPCRLPGCEALVAWDPARSPRQNALVGYCCRQHKERAFYRARMERARAAAAAAPEETRGKTRMPTKRKEPRAVVGPCRLPGCGKPVPWDPAKSTAQNLQSHYCCEEHRTEMYRLRRRERSARERAEVAAGTRPGRARAAPPGGRAAGRDVPDRCEAEAARVRAYWAALGYDVETRVVEDVPVREPNGRTSPVRRVVSDLVGGKPRGATWEEVARRMRTLERSRLLETRG